MSRVFTQARQVFSYFQVILPLIFVLLLQRSEHLVDSRFMAQMGEHALSIHSVFYILFLVGQAVGLASSASLLTLWKRGEFRTRQRDLFFRHLQITFYFCTPVVIIGFIFLNQIMSHFVISGEYLWVARVYLSCGLLNIPLQATLSLVGAALIASDLRMKSMLVMAGILVAKTIAAFVAVRIFWSGELTSMAIAKPAFIIGVVGLLSVSIFTFGGIRALTQHLTLCEKTSYSEILQVWNAEIGVAFIRSLAPVVFSFQLVSLKTQDKFYVTYQLALQSAYFLVLPLLAGNQLAVRDASSEQSAANANKILPLNQTNWFQSYLWGALIPSEILLFVSAMAPSILFQAFYGVTMTSESIQFLNLYFSAVMIGQVGNFMQIRLRSIKMNKLVTYNTFISEIIVQIGLMQLLLSMGVVGSLWAGVVTLVYCCSHFAINWFAVHCHLKRERHDAANITV
jgi:hypothetical protein